MPDDSDDDDFVSNPKKKKGPLFGIKWFRVTLDEAHIVSHPRAILRPGS